MLEFQNFDRRSYIDAGGCRLFIAEPQDANVMQPAIVLVPGAYHGAWCYSHYLDFFEQQAVDAYAVDLPGHGSLAAGCRLDVGIDALGRHLAQACAALDRRVVLVGHSMGALPVMLAAAQIRPAGVVLLAPSPPGNLPGALALPPVPADRLRPPPSEAEVHKRFLGTTTPVDASEVMARMRGESPAVLNDRYQLRVAVDASAIDCPGVCIEAGRDCADRHPEGQDRAVAEFLGLEYLLLAEQPHCMMYGSHWQESAEVLLDWYRRTFCTDTASAGMP
ncbi:alpha/beta fold hydrolase [Pusillimonas sp. TS35]|uniref:alpha/beta hydrolase n=1 Tax=Paracandidimonas lactea TaxID=2895524 RepID=UPI0013694539|nr:alpha/beta hydrolase [Paracandidimonas lactea]MYN13359.1 alpha/beta fold hydrolase [Pusillimonas sp. TS35]